MQFPVWHSVLRMRIRKLISDNTSEVLACVDPLLEGESCSVTVANQLFAKVNKLVYKIFGMIASRLIKITEKSWSSAQY